MGDFDKDQLRYRDNTLHRGEVGASKVSRTLSLMKITNGNNTGSTHLHRTSSTKEYSKHKDQKKRNAESSTDEKSIPVEFLDGHDGPIMCFFIEKECVYTGGWDRKIISWNIEMERMTHYFVGHDGWICSMVKRGFFLFSGSSDGIIKMWDSRTAQLLKNMEGHSGHIQQLKIHCFENSNESFLFSCSTDSTIRVWTLESGECYKILKAPDSIRCINFYKDFILGSAQFSIQVWREFESEKPKTSLKGHEDSIWTILVHNGCLYSSSWDNTVRSWDLESFQEKITYKGHKGHVYAIAVADNILYTGSGDCTAKSWNAEGKNILEFKGHEGSIEDLVIQETKIYTASSDYTIRSWNRLNGESLHVYRGHLNFVMEIVVVDNVIFSRSYDGYVGAWGCRFISGTSLPKLTAHKRSHSSGRIMEKLLPDAPRHRRSISTTTAPSVMISPSPSNSSSHVRSRSPSPSSLSPSNSNHNTRSPSPAPTITDTLMLSPAPPLPNNPPPVMSKVFNVRSSPALSSILNPPEDDNSRKIVKSRSHQNVPQYLGNIVSQTSTVDSLNLEVFNDLPSEHISNTRKILNKLKGKSKNSPRKEDEPQSQNVSRRNSTDHLQIYQN